MKKILLTLLIMTASAAHAVDYRLSNSEITAMGGASATRDEVNPATLSNADYKFNLILPSSTLYVKDPQGFATNMYDFANDESEAYMNFDFDNVINSVSTLNTASSNMFGLASNFGAQQDIFTDDNSSQNEKEDALNEMRNIIQEMRVAREGTGNETDTDAERYGFSGSLNNANTQVNSMNILVSNTRDQFQNVSNKPISVGLLNSLGLILPQGKVPMAIRFNNSTVGGAKMDLAENDLAKLLNILNDTEEYFVEVDKVDESLGGFITSTEAYLDSIDETNYEDDPEKREEFEQALLDFESSTNSLQTVETSNGVYVQGELNSTAIDINISDLESTLDILGVNIAEVSLGSAYPLFVKEQEILLGAVLNIRHLTIFNEQFTFEDMENFSNSDQQEIQDRLLDNTKTQITANIDVGAAYNIDLNQYGALTTGIVIMDVIPQSFESSLGNKIKFIPKVKVGMAHNTRYSTLALDIDVTRNEAIGYGVDTQYLNLGAELRAGRHMAIRGGYKNNLALSQDEVYSAGLGFTPFGVGVDISGWAKPYDRNDNKGINGGLSAQFSMKF